MLMIKLGPKEVFTWIVGDPPLREKVDPFHQLYAEAMADGPELEHIKTTFRGLPFHANRTMQVWYGEHAKFIIGNIK